MTPFRPGFHPFWFWNADITAAEVRRQIGEMAAAGVRGFFIHPRQGLSVPYLSERFLDLVRIAVEDAARLGLSAHLYDEYPYPSGAAGGAVFLGRPEFLATCLDQRVHDCPGGRIRLDLPAGEVLACTAFPVSDGRPDWAAPIDLRTRVGLVLSEHSYNEAGLTAYNRKRFFASRPLQVLDADLPPGPHRIFASVQRPVSGHKYWDAFADVMNPAAVARFIELTHDRYAASLGRSLEGCVASVFVDEVAPSWSASLSAAFRRAAGYDLLEHLHVLQAPDHPDHRRVTIDFQHVRLALFVESFEKPIGEWCRRHGIRYAGEKNTVRIRQLGYMDIPGCDCGHTKAGAPHDLLQPRIRGNARAAASAAWLYGKEGALCECFHSLGWGATLQDLKLISEGLVVMGVRRLVPHAFFYSTHGLRKHDAPPSVFFQMPCWPLFRRLADRINRLGDLLEGAAPLADTLVVDPGSAAPTAAQLAAYGALLAELARRRVEFLVVDADDLRDAPVHDGAVRLRDAEFGAVVIPGVPELEADLAGVLDTLARSGVEVARGAPPANRPRPDGLRLDVEAGNGEALLVAGYRKGADRFRLALNTGAAPCRLAVETTSPLEEVALDDESGPALRRDGGRLVRDLDAFELVALREAADAAPPPARLPAEIEIPVRGPMRVTPRSLNLLRLDPWMLAYRGPDGTERVSPPLPAMPFANQVRNGRLELNPAIELGFGVAPRLKIPPLAVRFSAAFESEFDGSVSVVMEPGSIVGDWTIRVNDGKPLGLSDFTPVDVPVRGCVGADVTPYVRHGRNRVTVEVAVTRHDGGLVAPLYLAGRFAVEPGPLRLRRPFQNGAFEDYLANGLPHYAGAVDYETDWNAPPSAAAAGTARLAFDSPVEDACEVSLNGGPPHPVPWSPRRIRLRPGEVIAGTNRVRITVYTSLSRAFEGEWFDPTRHAYRSALPG